MDIKSGFSSFSTDDLKKAEEFYGRVLEVDTERDDDMGVLTLKLPGGAQVVVYPKDDHAPAEFTVLNFMVASIDGAVDKLTAKGISFERYQGFEHDEKGIVRSSGSQPGPSIAWFKDPAGNVLSLIQD